MANMVGRHEYDSDDHSPSMVGWPVRAVLCMVCVQRIGRLTSIRFGDARSLVFVVFLFQFSVPRAVLDPILSLDPNPIQSNKFL